MFGLLAAGVRRPGESTTYPLPPALADLEAQTSVGKLAMLP